MNKEKRLPLLNKIFKHQSQPHPTLRVTLPKWLGEASTSLLVDVADGGWIPPQLREGRGRADVWTEHRRFISSVRSVATCPQAGSPKNGDNVLRECARRSSFLRDERGTKTSRARFIFIYLPGELVSQNEPKTNKTQYRGLAPRGSAPPRFPSGTMSHRRCGLLRHDANIGRE